MATHSSILGWRIPWMEEPGGWKSPGDHKISDVTEQLTFSFFFSPLQVLGCESIIIAPQRNGSIAGIISSS